MLNNTEIVTPAQMRAIESAAINSGAVTGLELMERAGRAVAGQIRLRWPKPGRATVLCGPGNNGGDGYVVARHLHLAGWQVQVLGMDNTPGPDAAAMKRRWQQIGDIAALTVGAMRHCPDSDVYVDAIFGIGLTRPPADDTADLIAYLGGSGGDGQHFRERIVAVDCPSGLCLDSGGFPGKLRGADGFDIHARLTVAFDSPKPGHLLERGPECCGELVIADIGLRQWREVMTKGKHRRPVRLSTAWPPFPIADSRVFPLCGDDIRKQGGHKFDHGHALVVAGGAGHGGAARLTARAALRIGAGLVTIAPPQSALTEHMGQPDALMRRGIDTAQDMAAALDDNRITVAALGPGCGVQRAAALIDSILAAKRSCVLDADALTALAERGFDGLHDRCVLTPHSGEFARLFPDLADKLAGPRSPAGLRYADYPAFITACPDRMAEDQACRIALSDMRAPLYSKVGAARDAAARCGAVVLLKGPDTVVADPNGVACIHSAFDVPWLATAGSGDVLAGIITGLMARNYPAWDAARLGALIHAKAARAFGPGLIADDLPDMIPQVLRAMD